ncbi:polysaccharide biosynthesis/export family protein [Sphingomicrobium aestuariivivum]|uniref:polysaccharide biosynthesis/export family protein n=1 Tax=Sphingomicrobium aestuariivivum TaxID=1582356 RepID=UPI001FD70666|nr:polysaccharide biosynthesis/export family protein [Sphingomicrobium aestuariivivum]MCJ8191583.1 polysaccharide export protein [Sphingomicrobium aestuariivivum]
MRLFTILLAALLAIGPVATAQAQVIADEEARREAGSRDDTAPLATVFEPVEDGRSVVRVSDQRVEDYETNADSDMFGSQLFTGAFSGGGAADFNPDYAINVGDTINVRLWGGYNYQAALTVDAQGNIFLPNVGPINLAGVRNAQLQSRVEGAVSTVFRSNVQVYAALAEAQPVRVFVTGFVNRPGAYGGTSQDSVLNYLDQAGGIDPERGSYLNVTVRRDGYDLAVVNLYDFLLYGQLTPVDLETGDVIFVAPQQSTVSVSGLAENENTFEFAGPSLSLTQLIAYARPDPTATHVRVTRSAGTVRDVEYYALAQAPEIQLLDGDLVAFTADRRPGTITVRVEGEHEGPQEFVLPYGTRLGQVMELITFNQRSAQYAIRLYRESVKERQEEALEFSLNALERAALTARSGTREEAQLRAEEAALLLQFVQRARDVDFKGQVVIARSPQQSDLLLENGDIIFVPKRDGLVLVSGEVMFPNAHAYDDSFDVGDYINQAGGYSAGKRGTQVVVVHLDGSVTRVSGRNGRASMVNPGDEIMVLPAVDSKNRQIFKEVAQIIYQVALGAGVVLGL